MALRQPFEYDVSVAADKRRRRRIRGMSGAFSLKWKRCERPDCEARAEYRAPVSPTRLYEYRWYCLEHIREHNGSWNFLAGADEKEIEARISADRVWERPTWRLGKKPDGQCSHPYADGCAWARLGFSDPFEVLGDAATISSGDPAGEPGPQLTGPEQSALDTLGLDRNTMSRDEVRRRCRELIRDLHPDMNGGDASGSGRLSQILHAWEVLKKSRHFPD